MTLLLTVSDVTVNDLSIIFMSVMELTRRLPRHGIGCTVVKKGNPAHFKWEIVRVEPSVVSKT